MPAPNQTPYDVTTISYMAFNFFSATAIVFVNKILFQNYGMAFSTFVTGIHFIFTYLGTLICQYLGMFEPKTLSHLDVLPITIAFCGFVVFNNLSLQYNSVGFYQLMKVMTTPVIVVLQYSIYGVREDVRLLGALVPVVIGVALATVNDFSFNMFGAFWAVAGILSTSFYQLFVKAKQDSLGANSWQLLKYQAPQASLVVCFLTPLLDDVFSENTGLLAYLRKGPPDGAILMLVLSSSLAFCVNLSIYLVVGKTNPIVYNVLGHFKLLVILTGGLVFNGEDRNPVRLFGMFLAFAGIVQYTNLKQSIGNTWVTAEAKKSDEKTTNAEEIQNKA
jgi:solute carrier family 35 protein E3